MDRAGCGPVTSDLGAGVGYFTQPERAPFYGMGPTGTSLLTFAPVRTIDLPSSPVSFPLAPYGGVPAGPSGFANVDGFERQVLTTVRRSTIFGEVQGPMGLDAVPPRASIIGMTGPGGMTGPIGPTGPLGPTGNTQTVVTPQGLLARFDSTNGDWRDLTLGQTNQGSQSLMLTELGERMRLALMSNELFLVVTAADKFLEACSVQFSLDQNAFNQLNAATPPVPASVIARLQYLAGYVYESQSYFDAVVRKALGEAGFSQYGPAVRQAAAQARLAVAGFTFDLSPYLWAAKNSVLIFKYSDRPLVDLVGDLTSWTAGDAFLTKSGPDTQAQVQQFIADADARASTDSNFDYFVNTVCRNLGTGGGASTWTGLLCLNCTVPLTSLPPQLEGLSAGINPKQFQAHHFGINQSAISLSGDSLGIDDSALFGLIDYNSPTDLYYQGTPYAFKVLTLHVLFANSQVTNFASQIELLVGELFGERSALPGAAHGDNLVLNGIWQHRGGVDSYAFTDQDESVFVITSQVLDTVSVTNAQFLTVIPAKTSQQLVRSRFVLAGKIRWQALSGFDAFSFGGASTNDGQGGLAYSNLVIEMSFDPWTVNTNPPAFTFDASNIAFDLTQSQARPSGLYSRFPLRVSGFAQGVSGATPDSLGYMRTYSPLSSSSLEGSWYGLQLSLNLGSPGALMSAVGFYADVLLAWAPNATSYAVWTGLRLPGSSSGGKPVLTIEGPLQLSMAAITFLVTDADDAAKTAYMLKFSSIALKFLGVSFPPGGQVDAMLFGNPDPTASATSLGWYAAYAKDDS